MASRYRVAIIDVETGEVVTRMMPDLLPHLRAEADLIENLKHRVRAKGVGLGCTADHVCNDVGAAMEELIMDLKLLVPQPT